MYLSRDILVFVMYCVYVMSGPSLLAHRVYQLYDKQALVLDFISSYYMFYAYQGQSRHLVNFFYFDAAALILTSIIYMLLELGQIISRKHRYLKEIENYIQLVMFISVIIFAFPVGQNSCWYLPGWKWQIGALAVFLAWINLLLLIRYIPWCKVGQHSTMMFNVYICNFCIATLSICQ